MSFPVGYSPEGLYPVIRIYDLQGTLRYTFESKQVIQGENQQDFVLAGGTLTSGINTDQGGFIFICRDDDLDLFDLTKSNTPPKIKIGWEVQLYLGKDAATLSRWYTGVVTSTTADIQTATHNLEIHTMGYGIISTYRYSSMNRTQKRLADGTSLDDTDNDTLASALFTDVWTDTDHLAVPTLGTLDITAPADTVIPVTEKLADYRKHMVTLGSQANELAQMVGADWGVDANKQAYYRKKGSVSSGFLITNDVNDNKHRRTKNWDQSKIAFIKSQNLIRKDSTEESGITIFHGIGSQRLILDHTQQNSNAILDLALKNYAFRFNPSLNNVAQVSLSLVRAGTITNDLKVSIIGAVNNEPNYTDIRETKILSSIWLEKQLVPGTRFVDIKFNKISVTTGERLFLLLEKSNNTELYLTTEYQTGSGNYYESDNLTNWTSFGGSPRFRTYASKTVRIIGQNTTTQKSLRPKEAIITLPDQPDEITVKNIFESIIDTKGKIVLNFDPILITVPTAAPQVGQTLRLEDRTTGFDKDVILTGYNLTFNAFDYNNLGASEMFITLQELYN